MTAKNEQYLTISLLKKRGWTDALISRYLGAPDQLKTNPHYRSGPPMKLYRTDRVEQAEDSVEFREYQKQRHGKREAAQKAVVTKRQKTSEYVANVIIKVPSTPKEELIRRACQNYNENLPAWKFDAPRANKQSDPIFLERICVNYLRHCLTQYEAHLEKIAGKVGVDDAYMDLKTKVLEAIADRHPWLQKECDRQKQTLRDQQPRM